MKEIYLDNSATTKSDPKVVDAVTEMMLNKYGNPSSLHKKGYESEKIVQNARKAIAQLLDCNYNNIIFTSGGTESNNIAVRGTAHRMAPRGKHLITTTIEHPSVLNTFKSLEKEGFNVTYLPVDNEGILDPLVLKQSLQNDTILVSIMHVNNEVGSIQPLQELDKILRGHPDILLHVDAVQSAAKIPLSIKNTRIDLLSISAHKFHGPKGIGALYVRSKEKISPLITGGNQENSLRSGTENTPGIAGFGTAAALALARLDNASAKMREIKNYLTDSLTSGIENIKINGPRGTASAPHILNLSFPGIEGEVILHSLEDKGIFVSTGSACHSRQHNPSHVLTAMGLTQAEKMGAIRISLSHENTIQEAEYTAGQLTEIIYKLRDIFYTSR